MKTILINLILVDRKTIWRLNKKYRGVDKPTTVLSFYYKTGTPLAEIIICPEEAGKQNLKLEDLVAHGFKNLLSEIPTEKIFRIGSSRD